MARSLDHFGYCSCGGRKKKKIFLKVRNKKLFDVAPRKKSSVKLSSYVAYLFNKRCLLIFPLRGSHDCTYYQTLVKAQVHKIRIAAL